MFLLVFKHNRPFNHGRQFITGTAHLITQSELDKCLHKATFISAVKTMMYINALTNDQLSLAALQDGKCVLKRHRVFSSAH